MAEEKGILTEWLDRLTGKESTLAIDLDDVGIDLGGDRKVVVNGKIRLGIITLR